MRHALRGMGPVCTARTLLAMDQPDADGRPRPGARGCAAAYFPETDVLVPLDPTADRSTTPTSRSVVVRLERRGA